VQIEGGVVVEWGGEACVVLCCVCWFGSFVLVLVGLFMAAPRSRTHLFMGNSKCNRGGVRSWCSFVSLRHLVPLDLGLGTWEERPGAWRGRWREGLVVGCLCFCMQCTIRTMFHYKNCFR
jgi:hypothetical protein